MGHLVRFSLHPGQRSEIVGAPALIDGPRFDAVPRDKAFDADHLRRDLMKCGANVVIPAKRNGRTHIPQDADIYEGRHLVEIDF